MPREYCLVAKLADEEVVKDALQKLALAGVIEEQVGIRRFFHYSVMGVFKTGNENGRAQFLEGMKPIDEKLYRLELDSEIIIDRPTPQIVVDADITDMAEDWDR